MKKQNIELNDKIKMLYFEYYTNYLLFENKIDELEETDLDLLLEEAYIYYLFDFIKEISKENRYPIHIFNRIYCLLKVLQKKVNNLDTKEKYTLQELLNEMITALDTVEQKDDSEIYSMEFIAKFSSLSVEQNLTGVQIEKLEHEFEKDFFYLQDILSGTLTYIKEYPIEEFHRFLQKLMVDLPEFQDDPTMLTNIKKVLTIDSTPSSKKWLHFLKEKQLLAFDIESFEIIKAKMKLESLLASSNIIEELKKIEPQAFYTSSFYNALDFKHDNLEKEEMSNKQKNNMYQIIQIMKDNLSTCPQYRHDFLELINRWIVTLNIYEPIPNGLRESLDYQTFYGSLNYLFRKNREENVGTIVEKITKLSDDIMTYFVTDDKTLKEQIINQKDILWVAINNICLYYPEMFMDDVAYEKINELINYTSSKEQQKIKKKIIKVRKG
jgi:hypothetical protein